MSALIDLVRAQMDLEKRVERLEAIELPPSGVASHVIATTAGLGASHTTSGLTAGQVLRATGATTAAFQSLADADLPATIVRTSRNLTAGAGLTGGGTLAADRTFDVGAGAGITVNANDVALTTPGTLSASSVNSASFNHTHAITNTTAGAASTIVALDANSATRIDALGMGVAQSTTTQLSITQPVQTSGSPSLAVITGGAHTTLAASTEAVDLNFALNRTVQFATGALATQRAVLFQAPTYGFVGASTLTTAATVAISGAPASGTNATITNALALWVQGGSTQFDGNVGIGRKSSLVLFEVHGTNSLAQMVFVRWQNVAAGPFIQGQKSRGAAIDTHTIVQNNDVLLYVGGSGSDGSIFQTAGAIKFEVDGTPGATDMPGRITFFTAPDGSVTVAERMRIDNIGRVGIGMTPVATVDITQAVSTTGSPTAFMIAGGSHTTLTLAEFNDVNVNLARTVNFAAGGGTIATMRSVLVQPPTYTATTNALTLTTAATLAISGPPVASTNVTIGTTLALWVQAGNVLFAGTLKVTGAFGANGAAAQTAFASGGAAPAGGTGTAAGGYDTAAHRDTLITLVNNIRTALVNNGIMS